MPTLLLFKEAPKSFLSKMIYLHFLQYRMMHEGGADYYNAADSYNDEEAYTIHYLSLMKGYSDD